MLVVVSALVNFAHGLRDALMFHRCIALAWSSRTIRVRAFECLVLNGFLFLGSMLLLRHAIRPLFTALIALPAGDPWHDVGTAYVDAFLSLYRLLWLYPVYCLSFVLNAIWYQDIADEAFRLCGGRRRREPFNYQAMIRVWAEEVYRLLLMASFLIQITLTGLVGSWVLGRSAASALGGLQLAWLYSLYSFEYTWANDGGAWQLEAKLAYFERRWAYFAGFGAPLAAVTCMFPAFVASGLFALLFPAFIILAITAQPREHYCPPEATAALATTATMAAAAAASSAADGGSPVADDDTRSATAYDAIHAYPSSPLEAVRCLYLPIFRLPKLLNLVALRVLQTCHRARRRRTQKQKAAEVHGD